MNLVSPVNKWIKTRDCYTLHIIAPSTIASFSLREFSKARFSFFARKETLEYLAAFLLLFPLFFRPLFSLSLSAPLL